MSVVVQQVRDDISGKEVTLYDDVCNTEYD